MEEMKVEFILPRVICFLPQQTLLWSQPSRGWCQWGRPPGQGHFMVYKTHFHPQDLPGG